MNFNLFADFQQLVFSASTFAFNNSTSPFESLFAHFQQQVSVALRDTHVPIVNTKQMMLQVHQ
ncbi:hypothetical protein Hdeb2414_s0017g00506351 [Helianthus debilis subsp. tardiflorus]